ncbi:hypothetical protein RchiOBHm_Chr2g0157291 [Rosa chinensis]|uniref:Uncharacterized protein n=1 Tax=Rosa chinensis TaxID=74649 RepID=A0A2P6S1P3_ROSCH|nr:hypothetical protein RchiOBHm_Chr2g0157291 [Rosa chinensis]
MKKLDSYSTDVDRMKKLMLVNLSIALLSSLCPCATRSYSSIMWIILKKEEINKAS